MTCGRVMAEPTTTAKSAAFQRLTRLLRRVDVSLRDDGRAQLSRHRADQGEIGRGAICRLFGVAVQGRGDEISAIGLGGERLLKRGDVRQRQPALRVNGRDQVATRSPFGRGRRVASKATTCAPAAMTACACQTVGVM